MSHKCFLLEKDYNHSGDPEKDAFCIEFIGIEDFGSNMMGTEDFEVPTPLYFTANFEVIPAYDYPLTDLTAPIVSKKMLNVLTELKEFNYRIIPVVMIDDSYLANQFDDRGNLKSEVPISEDYLAMQLKQYTESFDAENSKYGMSLIFPNKIGAIERLVLKEPYDGFPPVFRIKECINKLFVSAQAKEALEKAGVKGCVFEPVETT